MNTSPVSTGDRPSIVEPALPERSTPYSFPVLASLAPVLGSILIWAITRSPFALVFAFLGPLVALGGLADARFRAGRRRRAENRRFAREICAVRSLISTAHSAERDARIRAAPSVSGLRATGVRDPERWRADPTLGVWVRIGLGQSASDLRLDAVGALRGANPVQGAAECANELELIRSEASVISGVPLVVDARLGIGICGPPALVEPVARGILLQMANALSPATFTLEFAAEARWNWLAWLPFEHREAPEGRIRFCSPGEQIVVAVAGSIDALPAECRIVLDVQRWRTAWLVRSPALALESPVEVEFISVEQASLDCQFLSAAAHFRGLFITATGSWVGGLAALPLPRLTTAAPSLAAVFAVGRSPQSAEPRGLEIDLVRDGPHAIVGGTTGSGKSELLVSWILALSTAWSPAAVNFLLIDFKGGSAFAPLRDLPHVVGIVTDLDGRQAARALLSLRAESRFRERTIADAGASAIDNPAVNLPRLVIVVDEFAAMASDFPELHELFVDLAARGRSLGLHLILCTQRPAGVVRDSILANSSLRISLRVNNRADSIAVIGTADAAELAPDQPGLVVLSRAGGAPERALVVRSRAEDLPRVGLLNRDALPIRRPWCEDLPDVVYLSDLVATPRDTGAAALRRGRDIRLPFGLGDFPDQQCQQTVYYEPATDGHLLAIGAKGSGKSRFLATCAVLAGARLLASTVEESWDQLAILLGQVRNGDFAGGLLLIDDPDSLVSRYPADYQAPLVDRLVELAQEGPAAGLFLVLATRRVPSVLSSLAALCESRLVLRMPNRQEHLLAGGSSAGWSPATPVGEAEWKEARVKIAITPGAVPGSEPDPVRLTATPAESMAQFVAGLAATPGQHSVLVVSTRAREFTVRLRAEPLAMSQIGALIELAGSTGLPSNELIVARSTAVTVFIGDPESWQARWSVLAALRPCSTIVFDRCSVQEFRSIAAQRSYPPPLASAVERYLALDPDGTVRRIQGLPARAVPADPQSAGSPRSD